MPAALHRHLVAAAAAEALSLNEYCVQRLGGPDLHASVRQQVGAVLASASSVAGAHLLGVIAHGSWVRGEARESSDVANWRSKGCCSATATAPWRLH